ncbi:acyltransferase family protein [Nocardia thailandica]|uniref:acyltransferase family protein n=1 Tax=Nocardia thailandica TaxID=257275 RepID=UPI0002F4D479|nr:acyltransferase family protein [Nocardia thailandica]
MTTESPPGATAYRSDLDGLRGLAIALVAVFHVWFGRVSGGVDVFLVLSGYFFTGMVVRRASGSGSWGLPVLRRTARRLLPAMAVVLAAVVAGTVVTLPFTQWSTIAAQTLASIFYVQNWQLAMTWSDYLAADPSVSPLQHLWSMSVQGQFYLAVLAAVAAIAFACRRAGRPDAVRAVLGAVVVVGGVLSFLYATRGTAEHQGWTYYDSVARGWELLAGAGLALAAPYLALPRRLRGVLSVAGVAGVVLCGWLILDGANRFPGPVALLPVGAAVAVILAANNAAPADWPTANRLLAHPFARWLGDIAYPLYLWHWPLLIFYLTVADRAVAGLAGGLGVLAVSVLLAWATHRWVEEPLRERGGSRDAAPAAPRGTGVVVSVLLMAVVATTAAWQVVVVHVRAPQTVGALDPWFYPGAAALTSGANVPRVPMRPTLLDAPVDAAAPTGDGCIADWYTREVVTCTYGDTEATRTLAVVGSSHAEHWLPALEALAAEHAFRIQVYLKMGCPLDLSATTLYRGEANPDCRDWSAEVIDRLGAERPDWVFTTGSRPRADIGDETPEEYLDVWAALSERGLSTVVIRDTPWLRRDSVRYKAVDCLAKGGDRLGCGMTRTDALDAVDPMLAPAARFPSVHPIDLTDAVCEPTVCAVVEGNVLVYHDEHHLTASYARTLADPLGRALQPILGWW